MLQVSTFDFLHYFIGNDSKEISLSLKRHLEMLVAEHPTAEIRVDYCIFSCTQDVSIMISEIMTMILFLFGNFRMISEVVLG